MIKMFSLSDIKQVLLDCINNGKFNFILFPFGDNGVLVKNLLSDYFNIRPVYIVDNKYCSYNPDIISFNTLCQQNVDNCTLVLTAEDEELNAFCEELCLKCFDRNQILNLKRVIGDSTQLLTWKCLEKRYCEEAFGFSNFSKYLGLSEEVVRGGGKIKVRILHNGARLWNAFETICRAFLQDERFDVLLILYSMANDFSEMEVQAKSQGYGYVDKNNYNPRLDKPDIFIYASPFIKEIVKPMCTVAKISFIIPITLMLYAVNKTDRHDFAERMVQEMEETGVDYCLAERYLYSMLPKSEKVIIKEFGNPKLDILYRLSKENKDSKKLGKMKNKYVILFVTTHGSKNGRFADNITFDIYVKQILDYAIRNPDIGLIFRPHPLFIVDLLDGGYWQEEDVIQFKTYMESTDNMIWDDNDTYEEALAIADVIISDGYCGMVLSTFPLLKPICALYRDHQIQSMCPELDEFLYVAREKKELESFLEQVVQKKSDPMFELRKNSYNNFIKYFDGKNGKRVKDFISSKYFELVGESKA